MDINALTQGSSGNSDSANALSSISDDFDMFLTLLTTQLQNQDPLDPMDNSEMTNQLVNFANVEQQIQQNSNLESLIALQEAGTSSAAVAYIGKDIQIEGNTMVFSGSPITFGYGPDGTATDLSINILDADGNLITTVVGETSAQRHTYTWDGTDDEGNTVPNGTYQFLIGAFDDAGESVLVPDTDITGHVTGTASDDSGTYVLMDDVAVLLGDIISVRQPAST